MAVGAVIVLARVAAGCCVAGQGVPRVDEIERAATPTARRAYVDVVWFRNGGRPPARIARGLELGNRFLAAKLARDSGLFEEVVQGKARGLMGEGDFELLY